MFHWKISEVYGKLMNKIRKEGIIMNYLLVSPNFPTSQESFVRKLVEKGVRVLGIVSENYDNLTDGLKNSLTEYYKVNDLENYEEVLRGVAFLIYKHGVIDRVESNNEYWLTLDSIIREQFNIPGVKPKNLDFTKYKSKMKERFIKAKIPVAKGKAVKNIRELEKAIKDIKLPVIAKPDNGVGASATYKLKDKKDVENFKKEWDGTTHYFLEPFVDNSDIVTFDGLVDAKGNIVFYTSIVYYHTPLDLLNNKNTKLWKFYSYLTYEPGSAIEDITSKIHVYLYTGTIVFIQIFDEDFCLAEDLKIGTPISKEMIEKYGLYEDDIAEDEGYYESIKYKKLVINIDWGTGRLKRYNDGIERIIGYEFDGQGEINLNIRKDEIDNCLECKNLLDIYGSLRNNKTLDADIEKREIYGQLDNYKFTFDLVTRDIKSIQNLETGEFIKTYN